MVQGGGSVRGLIYTREEDGGNAAMDGMGRCRQCVTWTADFM